MVNRRALVAWSLVVLTWHGAGCGGDADESASDAASPEDASSSDASASDAAADVGGDSPAETGGDAGYTEPADPSGSWRSALFPRGWLPADLGGLPDSQGRLLPDFSYAGYHRGEQWPPVDAKATLFEVPASLGDGATNATAGIQAQIDKACAAKGGVVHLPAGLFVLKFPSSTARGALTVGCSNVVLRGEGPTKTKLLLDDPKSARGRAVVFLGGTVWVSDLWTTKVVTTLAADTPAGTRAFTVKDPAGLAPGMWIAVRNANTDAFRAAHRMDAATSKLSGLWPADQFKGLAYPRRIVSVTGNTVTVDVPLRYPLTTRDAADVVALVDAYVSESGIEHLGIGMVENRTSPPDMTKESTFDNDYQTVGTTGYEVHDSKAIQVTGIRDAWVSDVASFEPTQNTTTHAHLLSHGIVVDLTAFRVTVDNVSFGPPEYRGGGGNGYSFQTQGSDCLFARLGSRGARHGFDINQATSGNVWWRGTVVASRYSSDTHRFLAQANLFDVTTLDNAWLQAADRGTDSSGAGFTSTSLVFWNTTVQKNNTLAKGCAIETAQWDWGYAIGTTAASGAAAKICTTIVSNSQYAATDQGPPTDFSEGEGIGATLSPASLWERQRAMRCARTGIACAP